MKPSIYITHANKILYKKKLDPEIDTCYCFEKKYLSSSQSAYPEILLFQNDKQWITND